MVDFDFLRIHQVCPGCNGSGQINYFKGVSRFLLSCEECPECAGLGFRLDPEVVEKIGDESECPKKSRPRKKLKEKRS